MLIFLIVLPIISGLLCFTSEKAARYYSLIGALLTLALIVLLGGNANSAGDYFEYNAPWISELGSTFSLNYSGFNFVLLLLTALVFPLVFIAQYHMEFEREDRFYGLMMLSMAGLMGVFLANDLLLFYFFWELALIPVYFLASMWGYDRRVKVSMKFFIYTFLGSLIMLAGIIYLYLQNPANSFQANSMISTAQSLPESTQLVMFWLFFIAFAIKMPIFPFHTWQPDTYDETFTPVTVILSAIMVKMGLFAVMKWLMPLFPQGFQVAQSIVMVLCVITIVYGSILALTQSNIKRLLAYSSIAHIGLMCLGIFSNTEIGMKGALLQMFNHGISIAGLWLVVWILEQCYKTKDMKEMGGLAILAPTLSIVFVIISFSNIALPLTNGFVGEFMLFTGVFTSSHPYHIWFMVIAGLGVILGAIYMLNMLQRVVFGKAELPVKKFDITPNELIALIIIVGIILIIGVYPNAIMQYIHL